MKKVNDYDHYAARRQQDLQSGVKLAHRFVEKPAMEELLPDLQDRRVLMLGCGSGEETTLLEEHGATDMVGIDLSTESIRLAQATYPNHTFTVGDIHSLEFTDESFDFVYSSLTIHYSQTPEKVYEEIYRILKPGGVVQFSVGHPLRWASERCEIDGVTTKLLGYSEDKLHPQLYGNYSDFAEYEETFPSGEVLQFWIGPPSFHFGLLQQIGFTVENFVETKAVEACKQENPYYYERFSRFPQFIIFRCKK